MSPDCTKVANLSYKVRNEGIWTPVHNLHFRIVERDLGLKVEVERAGNFLARELSWAFQTLNLASWAESSLFRFWIWRAELSRAFSDFEFGELSWAELFQILNLASWAELSLARAQWAKKRAQTEARITDMASWLSWTL